MANFTGQLNANEIFSGLFNMIISQEVFGDNIAGTSSDLVDMSSVDGSMYGDTKLYYATDALKSAPWGNDAEATNLLALHRPPAPKCQAIELNVFRQISLTADNYLTKRAWATEGAFSSFNSIMLGWIRDTKRIYKSTTFNAYVGTAQTTVGAQTQTITLPTDDNAEAQARLQAQFIAKTMAKLLIRLKDVTRDYNDYGFMRSFRAGDLIAVWNEDAIADITKMDIPTIFHNDNLIDKLGEYTLPARFFGDVNSGATEGNGSTVRSLIEQDITKTSSPTVHVFAGDLIPTGYTAPAGTSYTENAKILFKIMHRRSVPFMSAFEVGTSFFNPKSLTENHYLTWGHNTLEYLKNYPFITVKSA